MKMTSELLEYFDITINETIITVGEGETRKYREGVKAVHNPFNAFCWGVYQLTNKQNGFKLGDMARAEGLEDSHMLTAIKKILIKYK